VQIIHKQRFFDTETYLEVRASDPRSPLIEDVVIRSYQAIVYVSLLPVRAPYEEGATPIFPALLDTGCNYNFHIDESHLRRWARLSPSKLQPKDKSIHINGSPAKLASANIWLHFNGRRHMGSQSAEHPNYREFIPSKDPVCLEHTPMIAYQPAPEWDGVQHKPTPRIPTLGIRSLVLNKLTLTLDAGQRTFSISRGRSWF
jgi:hypothetical protein